MDRDGGSPVVAIVDYGLGNLFSVSLACQSVGLIPVVTSSLREMKSADAIILPGIGAFGDAMAALERLELVDPIRELATSGKPLIGICLGLQLLMTESYEFGRHRGLDIIPGSVVRFEFAREDAPKVPQVGWNRVFRVRAAYPKGDPWDGTMLSDLSEGTYMYFVHSYYVIPDDPGCLLSVSDYGGSEFCSSLRRGNIFACQFHPERSGHFGLTVYRNIRRHIESAAHGRENQDA